jgi:Zn-dependent metalloprotease
VKRLLPLFIALSAVVLSFPRLDAQQRRLFTTGTPAELAQARSIGLARLRTIASRKAIDRPNDLVVSRTDVDRQAMAHTRVQQFHRGVPVFGGEAIAHLNPDGGIFAETDNLVSDLAVDTTPRLTQAAAIAIAVADYGCSTCLTAPPGADVWILRDEFGADHLAFRVQLTRLDGTSQTALPVRFVDAHSGAVVLAYDNLQTGSGASLYSGTVTIGTSFNDVPAPGHPGGWYMENLVRRVGTFDIRNATGGTIFRFIDADDIWGAPAQPTQQAAVDAHFGAERFLDYLQTVHGRNGIDGLGGPLTSSAHDGSGGLISAIVHFGSGYNNAFWDPSRLRMVYGDGDGSVFSPLVSLDIAGHEMTHGVTQFTAGLTYTGESGALNESWSDVFGAMLERHVRGESADTWLIAEQAFTPGTPGDALRYLDDPHRAPQQPPPGPFTADDDPDHYSERYTGPEDRGGVHHNAGIANKAFYLLAKGGSHHLGGSMTGIGADQAAQIWFTALTSYMTSSTNFAGARSATMLAAAALYGSDSPQEQAVSSAWCLVGVGACPTVQAISVTPSSGSGATQAFTLRYSDSLGATDLSAARVGFGAANLEPGTCTASYNATNGVVDLLNDAGTAWISGTMGGTPLSNSQCTLNLAGSSATPNGNDLTVVLNITFSGSFTGLKQIYMLAKSAGGVSTGWQERGIWTPNPPSGPYPLSVTPGVGLGTPQSFLLQYTDSSGAANLKAVKVRFGASNVNPGTCTARYRPTTGGGVIDLLNDAGTAWIAGTGTLSNSQCTLDLAGSSATASGNDLTVLLNISFSASFVGQKTIFMHAKNASQKSGWLTRGTWTVPVPGPNAASVTPSSGAGLAQAFTLQYSDSAGAANLASVRVRFGASNVGPATCTARYKPAGGIVELLNDAGTAWASGTFGTGTLANSQCTLKLASSSATPNGAILTVVLDITFSSTFAGQKTVYMLAKNAGGVSTGWQQRGTWTVPAP